MHSYGNAANTVQKPNNTMTLDQKTSGSTPDGAALKGLKMICFQTFFFFDPAGNPMTTAFWCMELYGLLYGLLYYISGLRKYFKECFFMKKEIILSAFNITK